MSVELRFDSVKTHSFLTPTISNPSAPRRPPRACASLCRPVRLREAASSDHTAHLVVSPPYAPPRYKLQHNRKCPRVSLGCDASGLNACVCREGEAACGEGEDIR